MDSFIDAYKDFWRRYAQFSGRTSVGGFWRPYLINMIIMVVGYILAFSFARAVPALGAIFIIAVLVYLIATFVPNIAIAVRRLHDTDKSGWMYLLGFVPFGGIILIVFWAMAGTPGNNQYGPQPLGTQWTMDEFPPGAAYIAQVPGGTPPPPPPPGPPR